MHLSSSKQDHLLIVTPELARLDAPNAPQFKEQILALLTKNGEQHLIFDLHQLQFIDSAGLAVFLSILREVRKRNGEIKLASLTRPVRTIFEMVSMNKIFEIFNSTEEAVKAFK